MRLLSWIAALLSLALIAGCATAPKETMSLDLNGAYTLDSGDNLRVTVFGQPDLSGTFLVNKAGQISYPLVGDLQVRDLTTERVAALISQRLSTKYVRNPDVAVEVAQYRPFFIMGEVASAGQYAYVAGMTVEAAIATAGGFTPRAWRYSVTATRKVGDTLTTRKLKMTDIVMPGDTIRVGERFL